MKLMFSRSVLNTVFVLSIIIMATLSIIFYQQLQVLYFAYNRVTHTYTVIEAAETLLNDLNYSEDREAGYLLTGDKSCMNMYNLSVAEVKNDISALVALTKDNIEQQSKVKQLSLLLQSRLQMMDTILQSKQSGLNLSKAQSLFSGEGKILGDKIHQAILDVIQVEKNLLESRSGKAIEDIELINMLALFGAGLSLALIILCFVLLNELLNQRIKAENKLNQSERELSQLAYFDSLTGLANRTLLLKMLDEALTAAKLNEMIVAVLHLDIDNFKNINDSLGHDIGDVMLQQFSSKIDSLIKCEKLLSRTNGDEFVLVLTNIQRISDVTDVAKQIIESMSSPITVQSHQIFITVSIGISIFPHNGSDARTLLKNADIATYRAKELGKNNYQFCTNEMSLAVQERAMLDYHLHEAIVNQEFVVLYQPKVATDSEKPVGVEALMRWHRPQSGLIYPSNFIALAESNGLIVKIGQWMLREVCEQAKKWEASGFSIDNIALNISTRQLMDTSFLAMVRQTIAETHINPAILEFEITESILMENTFNNIVTLRALKEMGIKITIDDFGTGFSSLSYLRLFAVDKLKIDQSFVESITSATSDSSIINAIIVMAHSLGIRVVAEGVETAVQLEFLKHYHCDEIQGFYFSHPIVAAAVPEYFASKKTR